MQNKRSPANRQGPQHYEIRVRGAIGPTLREAFPTMTTHRRGEDTILCGSLPDQSALYGVLHELEALCVELVELRRRAARGSDGGTPISGGVSQPLGSSRASV